MARSQPKYHHISEHLLARIVKGEWEPGERLPSEQQIAEEYGVSYMTVRNAVSSLVESEKLRRIRGRGTYVAEVVDHDSRPTLGLLLTAKWHSVDPFYYPSIVDGFVEKAESFGYQVSIADQTEPLLDFLNLRRRNVSAVACVVLGEADLAECDDLLDRGVSVVAINKYGGSRRIPSVSPNNREGAYLAAKHLMALGHKSFAFLDGPEGNFDSIERLKGIERAFKEHDLPARNLRVLEGGFMEESGYERGIHLAASGDLPTAVMAVSDLAAIGLMRAFAEQGVRIPQDVSLFGFGDFRLSAYLTPSLSTVRLPLREIGAHAALALVEQCRGVRTDAMSLPCPIIVRESVGSPRT